MNRARRRGVWRRSGRQPPREKRGRQASAGGLKGKRSKAEEEEKHQGKVSEKAKDKGKGIPLKPKQAPRKPEGEEAKEPKPKERLHRAPTSPMPPFQRD